ncbi:hypothetical protein GCM10008955_40860 [Deinococcus malanensis]|uniref:YCII-related domain-containing protein n=1 Tax=Deinococcus malanensis TaxID=1706855 RepID=A0ABQ2F2B2_9DEIO|nr:YciI family protein [Deinococcus malanensis]GGK42888.1 hypothetical protein GCM10008955_40860 [Deinococcus malanensis]
MLQRHVLHYTPGPYWSPGRPTVEQPLYERLAYLQALHQQGRILAGGPYTDHSSALVVLHSTTQEEAQSVVAGDPAVLAGIMTATLTAWHFLFQEEGPLFWGSRSSAHQLHLEAR